MPRKDNAYAKNFDATSFRELRPSASGLVADKDGVYLTGSRFFEGSDVWARVEARLEPPKVVFKYAKCKTLFTEADVRYSHKAIISEDTQWGMACYYVPLAGADPKTFKYLQPKQTTHKDHDGFYFCDAERVYYLHSALDVIFPVKCSSRDAFSVHDAFAQDNKHAFFMGKRITKSDAAMFQKIEGWYSYADERHSYENDNWTRVIVTPR